MIITFARDDVEVSGGRRLRSRCRFWGHLRRKSRILALVLRGGSL